ncbi:MAG: TonB-dependent receptor [Cyclobacteriaceae bacterium]|nr:TonB-dependent receptor [Cyclobacteriaceae bacterium]
MKFKLLRYVIMLSKSALRIWVVQLLCISLALGSDGNAQSAVSVKKTKIEVGFQNAKLPDVLSKIESETTYKFIYDAKDLGEKPTFSISNKTRTVADLLIEISKSCDLYFKQVNNNISVKQGKVAGMQGESLQVIIDGIEVTGKVISGEDNTGIPGVNIVLKGTSIGTITDVNGNYTIEVPGADATLVFSSVGYRTQEVQVNNKGVIDVVLNADVTALDEIVVIGYGEQRKASVVGSIVQTSGEQLMQSGGVSTIGQALSGRLPGVITVMSSGRPGAEAPQIFIRGQSTWNGGGQPLILVDGIERSMNDIDINEVENISVLKDASATAVYGVKGANGVILITTKRGKSGKTQLSISANSTVKTPSKLPDKYDAFDGYGVVNEAIVREVAMKEESWQDFVPEEERYKYRFPANQYERERYPNPLWKDLVLKDYAMDHRVNLSVRGGTDFAKYFGSLSYQHVGDIFNAGKFDNGRDYTTRFDYNRYNYRSNLDFDLTKTTKFSVNLAGYYGVQNGNAGDMRLINSAVYIQPPGLYYPLHEDGTYGDANTNIWDHTNPVMVMTTKGSTKEHRIQVNSDFALEQKLDFITPGLKFRGSISYDNNWKGNSGISEPNPGGIDNVIKKVYLDNGDELLITPAGTNQYDFVLMPWSRNAFSILDSDTERRLFYMFQFNYDRTFGDKHNVSVLALMNREKYAYGSMFPRYREDWVGRFTYNYDYRYFIDINGAYNGSEQFGPGYRFDLFPSIALGWTVSNESFMDGATWLDNLKFRGSYGIVGDDRVSNKRWLYITQWASGGSAFMATQNVWGARSPYTFFKEDVIGNPDLHWETSTKANYGLDMAVFNNLITLEADYFTEQRNDILIAGNEQAVPDHAGIRAPEANLGRTEVSGFEISVGVNHYINPKLKVWANLNYAKAKDKILFKAEPELREAHLKEENYAIGLPKLSINDYLMTSWNDVYMSVPFETDQELRRPGYYDLVDFNADGIHQDNFDRAPYGYPERPQDSWNVSLGTEYKGFSIMIQFYGAFNATKNLTTWDFHNQTALFFDHYSDYWSIDNPEGEYILPGWRAGGATDATRHWFDASYVRLKTAEIAYSLPKHVSGRMGIADIRFFVNGNNLFLWSHLPDDREVNGDNEASSRGDYPTFRRVNVGFNVNF